MESQKRKIIIFGASECGEKAFNYLSSAYNIVAFCDNDENKWGGIFCGKKVISSTLLYEYQDSAIVIALYEKYRQVLYQLNKYWHGSVYLFSSYVDTLDLIEKHILKELRWHEFILSSNKTKLYKKAKSPDFVDDIISEEPFVEHVHKTEKNGLADKNNKRQVVLIVANLFPPMGSGGVQRTTKFVKYLNFSKYKPVVLTRGYYTNVGAGDKSLLDEVLDVDIIRVMNAPKVFDELSDEDINKLIDIYEFLGLSVEWKRLFEEMFNKGECFLRPDDDILWIVECIKEIKKRSDLQNIDIVFTTAGPYSSFLLGYWMKKSYKTKWIMDFRDAWCEDKEAVRVLYPFRQNAISIDDEIEYRMTQYADAIIARHFLSGYIKNENRKILCIKNGYDESDFSGISYKKESDVFRILYNGQVYMNMNPLPLLNTINELIDDNIIPSNEICVEFNGQILNSIKDSIEQNDKYSLVRFNGYKRHRESLEMAASACLLVVFGQFGELANLTYTGKIFEYLRIGNPILSYSSDYGVQYDLLYENGLGITVGYENNKKAKDYISDLFHKWKSGEVLHRDMKGKIDSYSREYQAKQLIAVFDEIT